MPVSQTKAIAIAASRARNQIAKLREAASYFTDRGVDVAEMLGDGELLDVDLAEIDGDRAAQREIRDMEIASEEAKALEQVDAMNNAALDGDESKATPEQMEAMGLTDPGDPAVE